MPAALRLRLFSAVSLCLAAGCGSGTAKVPASPPNQVSPNAPQPPEMASTAQQAPAAAPAVPQPSVTASGVAGVQSRPAAEPATAREKVATELAESEAKAVDLAAQIAEQKARLAKMEERWSVLTLEERNRLIRIKAALVAGKGITLAPSDFLFVCGSENEIFVERELQAAAVISCGPFIDYLGERLGWPPERRIDALGVFARFFIRQSRRPVPEDSAQGWALMQSRVLYESRGHAGESTDDFEGGNDFVRLGVLAEVMQQRSRALTESEVVFLRELAPNALRKYLQLGPDPAKIAAHAAELARVREAEMAKARTAELDEARDQKSAHAAERATATKEIAAIAKQLDPLYTRKARMRKVDTDDPRALQNLDNLNAEIAAAERQLDERLEILFPNRTGVPGIPGTASPSGAEWDKVLAKLFPADKKTQQFLKRYCER